MEKFEYEYKKVADIKEGDTKINIIGVVKYFRSPKITSVNQYNLLCTVIDPSVEDNIENGIRCNLFAFEKSNLPQVENVGDIIRLHRVNVKSFNGRLQVQRTKATSWLVYIPYFVLFFLNFIYLIRFFSTNHELCSFYSRNYINSQLLF